MQYQASPSLPANAGVPLPSATNSTDTSRRARVFASPKSPGAPVPAGAGWVYSTDVRCHVGAWAHRGDAAEGGIEGDTETERK